MSQALTEAVQRLVVMEADLSRLLESSDSASDGASDGLTADHFVELLARLISNQRQIIETLVAISGELADLASAGIREG